MKIDRKKVVIKSIHDKQDDYVEGSPAMRIGLMWELTAQAWSFVKNSNVEQRLQRHITNLSQKRG